MRPITSAVMPPQTVLCTTWTSRENWSPPSATAPGSCAPRTCCKATCFFAIKDDVIHAGARYEDAEVVVDGNLVTSRKPEDLPAFCRASIGVLTAVPAL